MKTKNWFLRGASLRRRSMSIALAPVFALTGNLTTTIAFTATVLGAGQLAQAATGAIYTSDSEGVIVNENHYPNKEAVYLNGGPQNDNGPGLTPGLYYFQVTDPSGTVLLSTDNAESRQIIVNANGRVAGATGPSPHALGTYNPANTSTPVQLSPFADTPNNGGEYKVWLIGPVVAEHHNGGPNGPYDSYNVTISPTDPKVLVFSNSDAKTDNFKVETATPPDNDPDPITLSGLKYYDINANGLLDSGEVGVPGFHIEVVFSLSDNSTIVKSATTNAAGEWSLASPGPSELTTPGATVVGFTATELQPAPNTDGSYWMQTGPLLGDETANPHVVIDNLQNYIWTGSLVGRTTNVGGLDFGNICVHQPSGGFTLGYWSNKNGQAVLQANDPAWRNTLNGLNLRVAAGGDFTVPAGTFATAYSVFRTWDLGATATNMAYMLSVQFSATTLDTLYKGLNPASLLFLPSESAMQSNLAECYDANVVSLQTILTEANATLGSNGNTTSSGAIRNHQECLKNILDNVNNNKLLFVSPVPCPVVYPQ